MKSKQSNAEGQSNSSSTKFYDEDTVSEASRFLARLLRHGIDGIDATVNSRGWMSGKTVRRVLQENFPELVDTSKLLSDVIRVDDGERFQTISDDPMYTMIRARYGHTQDHIELYDLDVNDSDMKTFIVSATESGKPTVDEAYVSAVDEDTAKQIFVERELDNMSLAHREINISETDTVSLHVSDTPFTHYTQDSSYDDEVRSNMMGDKSDYVLTNKRSSNRKS